jgi:hypothetical protein
MLPVSAGNLILVKSIRDPHHAERPHRITVANLQRLANVVVDGHGRNPESTITPWCWFDFDETCASGLANLASLAFRTSTAV